MDVHLCKESHFRKKTSDEMNISNERESWRLNVSNLASHHVQEEHLN